VAVVRPRDGGLWGVDLVASASFVKFGGVQSSRIGGDSRSIGVDVYLFMRQSHDLTILPRLGVAYTSANAWRKEEEGIPGFDNTVESASLGFECAFLIERKYIIAPAVSRFDGMSTWSIMIGLAFPWEY